MTAPATPDLDALRRASRYAGVLTLAGVGIVLASIGYGIWHLSETEKQLESKKLEITHQQKELSQLEEEVGALRKAKDALQTKITQLQKQEAELKEHVKQAKADTQEFETQLVALRKETAFIRSELKKKFSDPKTNLELWAKPEYRAVMVSTLIAPAGRYHLLKKDAASPTGKWYAFTLLLSFPNDSKLADAMRAKIKSVTYDLNHPYRKIEPLVSKDAARNFPVRFEGAGTLRNVIVKIDVEGAGVVSLDYDMTKAFPEVAAK